MRYFTIPEIEYIANSNGFKILKVEELVSENLPSLSLGEFVLLSKNMNKAIPVNEPLSEKEKRTSRRMHRNWMDFIRKSICRKI